MLRDDPLVQSALALAKSESFEISSEPESVGNLLAFFAAAVPDGGRILELGTGCGVGTACLAAGLGARTDVELVTVEFVPKLAQAAAGLAWPKWVTTIEGNSIEELPRLGSFDLIFADGHGGKWDRVDLTLDAVKPGGTVLIDDMTEQPSWEDWKPPRRDLLLETLRSDPRFRSVEMDWASGLIMLARRLDS